MLHGFNPRSAFVAFAVTTLMLWLMQPLARRLNLLDHPQGRKDHEHPTPVTGGLLFEMLSEAEPRDPNAPAPRLGVRARDRGPGGNGPPKRGSNRPGGPKPKNGGRPSGGLKGVRKGKRK